MQEQSHGLRLDSTNAMFARHRAGGGIDDPRAGGDTWLRRLGVLPFGHESIKVGYGERVNLT
jgi:hypothetical protein